MRKQLPKSLKMIRLDALKTLSLKILHGDTLSNGIICSLIHDVPNEPCVLKYCNDTNISDTFQLEIQTWMKFNSNPDLASINSNNNIINCCVNEAQECLISEYHSKGNLSSNLTDKDPFKVVLHIGNALASLHKKGYCHNDVAARNILISDDGDFILNDFGECEFYESTDKTNRNQGDREIHIKKDIAALAIVFIEVKTRTLIGSKDDEEKLKAQAKRKIKAKDPYKQILINAIDGIYVDVEKFTKELGERKETQDKKAVDKDKTNTRKISEEEKKSREITELLQIVESSKNELEETYGKANQILREEKSKIVDLKQQQQVDLEQKEKEKSQEIEVLRQQQQKAIEDLQQQQQTDLEQKEKLLQEKSQEIAALQQKQQAELEQKEKEKSQEIEILRQQQQAAIEYLQKQNSLWQLKSKFDRLFIGISVIFIVGLLLLICGVGMWGPTHPLTLTSLSLPKPIGTYIEVTKLPRLFIVRNLILTATPTLTLPATATPTDTLTPTNTSTPTLTPTTTPTITPTATPTNTPRPYTPIPPPPTEAPPPPVLPDICAEWLKFQEPILDTQKRYIEVIVDITNVTEIRSKYDRYDWIYTRGHNPNNRDKRLVTDDDGCNTTKDNFIEKDGHCWIQEDNNTMRLKWDYPHDLTGPYLIVLQLVYISGGPDQLTECAKEITLP